MPRETGPATALLWAYALGTRALVPLAYRRSARKLAEHGMEGARIAERMGHASLARPQGTLVWFHGASVGESLSVLRLIETLGDARPDLEFLITTGTATSARILAQRMPSRCRHQFAPLDSPAAVARFLDHWRPDAGVFVESELWPALLQGAAARQIPLALLNARLSDRSARGWGRIGHTARHLLSLFQMVHCQDTRTEQHLQALGCNAAKAGANLKAMAGPLPYEAETLEFLQAKLGARPLWVMASTHPGEEEVALQAHKAVLKHHPRALMVLVPRHPERAGEIARIITGAGLDHAQRSRGDDIGAAPVYLADTLGEMGLWYRLAPLVCVGGTFAPVGGHNPFEVAHGGAAVLHGPLYPNFTAGYAEMDAAGAAREVADAAGLGVAVSGLLTNPEDLDDMRQRARDFAATQQGSLDDLSSALCAALGLR